jgi:hypothetical protein
MKRLTAIVFRLRFCREGWTRIANRFLNRRAGTVVNLRVAPMLVLALPGTGAPAGR